MSCGVTNTFYRGATVRFATTFYDFDGVTVVQPGNAEVHITYLDAAGAQQQATIAMTPPASPPADPWTAAWDTRGVGPGPVFYSIHTGPPAPPLAVQDGNFTLSANPANLETF